MAMSYAEESVSPMNLPRLCVGYMTTPPTPFESKERTSFAIQPIDHIDRIIPHNPQTYYRIKKSSILATTFAPLLLATHFPLERRSEKKVLIRDSRSNSVLYVIRTYWVLFQWDSQFHNSAKIQAHKIKNTYHQRNLTNKPHQNHLPLDRHLDP
jgi:hypothetical protein